MKDKLIERIERELEGTSFVPVWQDATETDPYQSLLIRLPMDESGRARYLIIKTGEEVFPMAEQGGKENFIQMIAPLPFKIPEEHFWEVLRIINFYNKGLSAPGFILDEGLGQVLFRYTFLSPGESIQRGTLLSLIGMVDFWLHVTSHSIEQTAVGNPMVQVIQEEVKALQEVLNAA